MFCLSLIKTLLTMRADNCAGIRLASVGRVTQLHERGDTCIGPAYIRPVAAATSPSPCAQGHSEPLNLKLIK
ncbi:MAG: hypothetical protein KDG49_09895 [Geminicoccaceae bacterium]|jgi:hypothetical protein|nr:hypothetical protein [Geminicoccaceae bacterium]